MKYGNRHVMRMRTWTRSPVTFGVLVFAGFVLAKASWNIHDKAQRTAVRLEQAQAELSKLEDRKDNLSRKVEIFSTDEGVEAEMRTKYRATKDGEFVAVIVEPKHEAATVLYATTTPARGWFRRLFGL